MAGSIRLKQLTVSGFRGFGSAKETIDLSGPMVIFSGGNRSGKSSTLNAIEWALYGDEIVGAGKVNIEERKGWLVKNMGCDRASVELVLESGDGDIVVRRSAAGPTGKKAQSFYYVDENGEKHDEEEGLWSLLGLGPKDFMSSAYLHQEVIRDLLVTQPSVRKAALDRLLGVSDLRNLFEAFKGIKVKSYETGVDEVYAKLENDISLRASAYKEQLEDAREEGSRLGLEKGDYTVKRFSAKCSAVVEKLASLAKKAKVEPAKLAAPGNPDGFQEFADQASKEIDRLRVENPGAESQRGLDTERRALDAARSRLTGATETVKEFKEEKRRIEKEHGTAEDIGSTLLELEKTITDASAQLALVSDRMNVVNETIDYLRGLADREASRSCPACGQEIAPEKLLESLKAFKEKSAEQTRELEAGKSAARKELKQLEATARRLAEILDEELPAAKSAQAECRKNLEDALGRKLDKDEDPNLVVERRISEIEKAIEKNRKLLEDYTAGLSEASRLLDAGESIAVALIIEKKIKKLNSVKKSEEWAALDEARDNLFEELGDVEKVKDVVEEVLGEVSRKKVNEARGQIASIYGRLVERPDFDEIEIDPDKNYEVYASGGGKREKLVSFFNQGDMNCAALAIFLALGTGRAENEDGASFLMMDDPSQSLDRVQKARLAGVIDEVTGGAQLLLSTMDEELLESARKAISREKRIFKLGAWDPKTGPSITEE